MQDIDLFFLLSELFLFCCEGCRQQGSLVKYASTASCSKPVLHADTCLPYLSACHAPPSRNATASNYLVAANDRIVGDWLGCNGYDYDVLRKECGSGYVLVMSETFRLSAL